jgi:hypothetical protein
MFVSLSFTDFSRCSALNELLISVFLLRKQCSAPKWKEMTGSGIFAAGGEAEEDESGNASVTPIRPPSKNYQVLFVFSARFLFYISGICYQCLYCHLY